MTSNTIVTRAAVLILYFAIVLILGFLARSRLRDSPAAYFLADRKLGTFVLICTMAATNFSSFTVLGASGAGYRDGLAFFPIMAFGTGFMALTFWLLGRKIWRLGKEHGLITPAELVTVLYNNHWLSGLFALVMVIFTIPYLAIQPMAGGYILHELFGLNQLWGAAIITAIILAYTLRGGLKAVAWTDVFQGFLMVSLMIVALVLVASHHGGLIAAASKALANNPELFSRPGGEGKFTFGIWFGFLILWFFCDPMFPQLFQRFYTAKSERSLARMMLFYPTICTVVFFLPVVLGIFGRLHFPDLVGKEADSIVPMLMTEIGGDFMGTLVLAAVIAAFMSTMDSQLLTLSSIFTRDILPFFQMRSAKTDESGQSAQSPLTGRLFVIGLALAGLVIAINPPDTILDFTVNSAFTGLAVLFPTVLFGLYLRKPQPAAAIGSILAGETLVVLYSALPDTMPTFGFLPAVPVIAGTLAAYIIIQIAIGSPGFLRIAARHWWYAAGFSLIFLLAMDFWRWGEIGRLLFGWPLWAWYSVALSILQTILMYFWIRPVLIMRRNRMPQD